MATVKKTAKSTKKSEAAPKEVVKKEEVVMNGMEASILKRTEEWAAHIGYAGYSSKTPRSEKVKAIEACLEKNDYSGKNESLAKIISVMIGEDVRIKSRGFYLEKGVMVVPLNNRNGHNYPLEQPILIMDRGNRVGIRTDGTIGNSLPGDKKDVRPATAKEIVAFFKATVE